MTGLLAIVIVLSAGFHLAQRKEIRTLNREAKTAALCESEALRQCSRYKRALDVTGQRNRELADQVGDLEEQLQGAKDELERLSRAFG